MIIEPLVRTRQPQASPCLDRSHPLAAGMAGLICGSSDYGLVSGEKLVKYGGANTRYARGGEFTFANTALNASGVPTPGGTPVSTLSTAQTVAAGTKPSVEFWYGYVGTGTGSNTTYQYVSGNYNGAGTGIAVYNGALGGRISYFNGSVAIDSGATAGVNTQLPQLIIVIRRASGVYDFIVNGVWTASVASSLINDTGSYFTVGAIGRTYYDSLSRECYTLLAGKAIGVEWSVPRAKEFRNPWQILVPEPRRVWVGPAAAASAVCHSRAALLWRYFRQRRPVIGGYELREDGSFELREDGSKQFRE